MPGDRKTVTDLPPLNVATFRERFSGGANRGRARDATGKKFTAEPIIGKLREAKVGLAPAKKLVKRFLVLTKTKEQVVEEHLVKSGPREWPGP